MRPSRKRSARYNESDEESKRSRGLQSIVERMSNAVYSNINAGARRGSIKKVPKRIDPPKHATKRQLNAPAKRHSNKTSSSQPIPKPTTSTSSNEIANIKPRLRRSVVMEAFTEFYFKKATAPRRKNCPQSCRGGNKLWKIMFVHGDYAFFLRKCMLKINLPLLSELIFNKDRYILRDFFGYGARLNPKVMDLLKTTNRLPLFDTIYTKSLEETCMALPIPTKVLNAIAIQFNSPAQITANMFKFYNKYLSEINFVFSTSSIEFAFQFLANLKNYYPHLTFVKIVYFDVPPKTKKLLLPFENKELEKFVTDIKEERIEILQFCELFNQHIFQAYPVVQFKMEVIYQCNSQIANGMKLGKMRRLNKSYILFEHGRNQIVGKRFNINDTFKYEFKIDMDSLM